LLCLIKISKKKLKKKNFYRVGSVVSVYIMCVLYLKLIKSTQNKSKLYLYNNSNILQHVKNISQNTKNGIKHNININITQKIHNPKAFITNGSHTSSFSVGSAVKFFKRALYNKAIRRSHKGVLIFINTIKAVLKSNCTTLIPSKNILLNIQGFDYNLIYLKKHIEDLFKNINI